MIEAKVTGFAELERAMRGLPKELEERVVRQMVAEGSKLVAREAAIHAPVAQEPHLAVNKRYMVLPGTLQASIQTWRFKDPRATVMNKVGPRSKFRGVDTFYWMFMEFGTRFIPARPFLRRAFDNNVHRVIALMRSRMERGVPAAWKSALRRQGR
jgi:HK97 gp10 family phage protein